MSEVVNPENAKVLVVVDPCQDTHPALERMFAVYANYTEEQLRSEAAEVVILILANQESMDSSYTSSFIARDYQWFIDMFGEASGTDYATVLTAWGGDWAQTIVDVCDDYDITFTMVPFYGEVRNHILSDERWKLLRKSKQPVMLVSQSTDQSADAQRKVLAAIKAQDPEYDGLNRDVLEQAQLICGFLGSELHVVNAYADSMDYPDRGRIAAMAGIDNDHVHVKVGAPDEVICDVASDIGAAVVMIASQRRTGLRSRFRGNTVEKIVGRLEADILMI